jgi:eukaryotic-like serine/threonine-protein kinase
MGGKYRLERQLGAGAMGTVYRAVDRSGVACAVKVLADTDDELKERFRREAEALFMLKHPNVLEIRDYGIDAETKLPFLVMELLEGRTLESLVVDHTPDPQTGLEMAIQVCRGLAYAHTQGVLHRDLKTENVFVVFEANGAFRAKLLDFGLVKFDDQKWGPAKKLTMQGTVFGSPAYMSPEQGTGTPLDARSDVYSMGVVLFEMITGEWPYVTESEMTMLRAHLLDPIPALASKREGLVVAPALEHIVRTALAKKPTDRFASAVEMLAALEKLPRPAGWIAGSTHVPPQPLQPVAAPAAPGQPRGVSWAIVAALVVVGALGFGAAAWLFLAGL